ncbi:hypothetical protein [Schlesneria paludicola]|uniref:hypothetical protein n=1 Tax=Schlesneria paludicola TaxID=360056 RepID=UPI00029B1CD8|nr:hypothetical protein [Schlesneria paludicola]
MDEFELEQLRRQPKWVSVLETYQQLALQGRAQSSEFDGWIPRIQQVTHANTDELPGIHGKLIAYGFLKFDLAGRDGGIRYQLTPLGKKGINGAEASEDDEDAEMSAESHNLLTLKSA